MKRFLPAAAVLLMGTSLPALANDSVFEAMGDPGNYAIQTMDYENTRFSPLDDINRDNVGDLQVAWTFSTGVLRGHEGAPLVIDDVMYVHTPFPNNVFALDLNDDGRILWRYEPRQDSSVIAVMCCDTVNRGLAYANGKIYLHQADTTVVALDAETGAEVWTAVNGDPSVGESNTATVLPVKDKLIVGISGGEFGVRGHVTAYDLESGEQVWRAYSTGPDDEMLVDPEETTHLGEPIGADSSLNSWEGDQWQIGGSTTWGWFSYDPEGNQYWMVGTGHHVDGKIEFPMLHSAQGARFGSAFDPDDVEYTEWGSLIFEIDCDGGTAAYDSEVTGFGSGMFQLDRLTQMHRPACPYQAPKLTDLYKISYEELRILPGPPPGDPNRLRAKDIAEDGTVIASNGWSHQVKMLRPGARSLVP